MLLLLSEDTQRFLGEARQASRFASFESNIELFKSGRDAAKEVRDLLLQFRHSSVVTQKGLRLSGIIFTLVQL